MTLPKITGDEDEADGDARLSGPQGEGGGGGGGGRLTSGRRAPGTGVRARALRQNQDHLAEHLDWNDELHTSFVNLGLLRQNVFGTVSPLVLLAFYSY